MGNACEGEDPCSYADDRTGNQMRENLSPGSKISQKDLVKIKKYPITQDYVVLSPPVGKGSFGTVHKIVNKRSGIEWAAKKIPVGRKMDKYFQ